jgi:drug/metabolite transporter (DMT)-like permease
VATYTIIDGEGGRRSGDPLGYTAWLCVAAAVVFLPLAFVLRGRALAAPLLQGWRMALAGGGASFASYGIAVWAMSRAPIGLVAALREASVLFAAALGAWFLKEPLTPARYLAAALVVGGLACMRVG